MNSREILGVEKWVEWFPTLVLRYVSLSSRLTVFCRQVHLLAPIAVLAVIFISRGWIWGLVGISRAMKVRGTSSWVPRLLVQRLIQPFLYDIWRGLWITGICVRIASWEGLARRQELSRRQRLSIAWKRGWMGDRRRIAAGNGGCWCSYVRRTLLSLF